MTYNLDLKDKRLVSHAVTDSNLTLPQESVILVQEDALTVMIQDAMIVSEEPI